MTGLWIVVGVLALLLLGVFAGGFLALAMGRLHLDLGWGRSHHQLGPLSFRIEAPRETVYELLAAPYQGRAQVESVEVLAHDASLVVAAHRTPVHFYESRTVETVELDPPGRIGFQLLSGPVPEASEEFLLEERGEATELRYEGTLGIDFFWLGRLAARRWVVPQWERTVREHLEDARARAEQRAERRRAS